MLLCDVCRRTGRKMTFAIYPEQSKIICTVYRYICVYIAYKMVEKNLCAIVDFSGSSDGQLHQTMEKWNVARRTNAGGELLII